MDNGHWVLFQIGDTSATASVQTIARIAETSSGNNGTKLSTTVQANSATNPCYLKTDDTIEVLEHNNHDDTEKISSNKVDFNLDFTRLF